jgi:hypothetical protein
MWGYLPIGGGDAPFDRRELSKYARGIKPGKWGAYIIRDPSMHEMEGPRSVFAALTCRLLGL